MSNQTHRAFIVLLMIAILLLIPPLVFLLVGIFTTMSLSDVINALVEQYSQRKQNLLVIGFLGCLPLLLLGLAMWLAQALRWFDYHAAGVALVWVFAHSSGSALG